jgi:hypothetical protein
MRNLILLAALLSLGASPAAADAAGREHMEVEVWADNDRDYFHSGDALHVRFRTSESAYVAVLHLTTSGEVEFLYPRSPWDDGYVRGRRSYSLPASGSYSRWSARGPSGIGYVYVIASEEPLDFSAFRDRYGHGWNFWKLGRVVRGDPFYALDRITEQLVPDWDQANYAVDYFSYHVGRRHSHPRYACYDGYGYGGQGWGEYYYSCDRLRVLLGSDPYYYDGRYHRGYRGYRQRTYLADAHRAEPRYRYKERTAAERGDAPPLRAGSYGRTADPPARTRPESRVRPEPVAREEETRWGDDQQEPRTRPAPRAEPPRSRPTLQRREPERESVRPRASPPPAREPQREAPREQPRSEPPPRTEHSRPSEEAPRVRPPGG